MKTIGSPIVRSKIFRKKNRIAQKYHFLPYLCDNHAVWTFGTTETEKSGSGPDFGNFSDMDGFNNPGNHCSKRIVKSLCVLKRWKDTVFVF